MAYGKNNDDKNNDTKLYRVKIKSTGKVINVYELLLGGYCDANNHTTSYAKDNLEFLEEPDTEEINHYRSHE